MVEPGERQRARVETRPASVGYVARVPEPTLGLVLLLGTAVLVGAVVQGERGVRDRRGGGAVRGLGRAGADAWVDADLRLRDAADPADTGAGATSTGRSLRAALAGADRAHTGRGLGGRGVEPPADRGCSSACSCSWSPLASAWAPAFEPRPRNLLLAGALTGISGTSAAVGGPFVAMTLQHEPAARIRATLAAFFTVGSLVSMAGPGGRGRAHP